MRIERKEDHRSGKENAVAPPSVAVDLVKDRPGENAEPLSDPGSSVDIEMLVRQFHGDLYRYAYRLSGQVEDIVAIIAREPLDHPCHHNQQ